MTSAIEIGGKCRKYGQKFIHASKQFVYLTQRISADSEMLKGIRLEILYEILPTSAEKCRRYEQETVYALK